MYANEESIQSSIQFQRREGKIVVQLTIPPASEAIEICLNSEPSTDLENVGKQLWEGSLLVADYLVSQ